MEEVLAIDLDEQHDCYSGRTRGVLTYREGKVARLNAWLEEHRESLEGAYFYSDSRNDLPLLSLVANPRTVNPDPTLRTHAEKAGWPILEWR
ncbi:HAD hydrolase, family IB [compost metagenome]